MTFGKDKDDFIKKNFVCYNLLKMKAYQNNANKRSLVVLHRFFSHFSNYLLIIVTFFLGVSLLRSVSEVKKIDKRIKDQENEVALAQKRYEELSNRLEFTKSREYFELQFRTKLGLAKEGEVVVILPPDEVLRNIAPGSPEEKSYLPDPNWKKWMRIFGII